MAQSERKLDVPKLEEWLWDAACIVGAPLREAITHHVKIMPFARS
jgi:hypothetical protein